MSDIGGAMNGPNVGHSEAIGHMTKTNTKRAHRRTFTRRAELIELRCAAPGCGRMFRTYSRAARYCCAACRVAGHRARAADAQGEQTP